MPFPDIESGNGNAHYECAHANVLSGENSFFWGVSQRDGARGSALPAGRDSDPKKKNFPRTEWRDNVLLESLIVLMRIKIYMSNLRKIRIKFFFIFFIFIFPLLAVSVVEPSPALAQRSEIIFSWDMPGSFVLSPENFFNLDVFDRSGNTIYGDSLYNPSLEKNYDEARNTTIFSYRYRNPSPEVFGFTIKFCSDKNQCGTPSSKTIAEERQETAVLAVAGTFMAFGILAGFLSSTFSYVLGIGFNATNLRALFSRGFYNFLTFLGIKKKSYIWGTVFDADTLIGLDPAYVVLHDASGNEIDTRITDINGRYGFVVAQPGTYYISANKVDYLWPSKKLAGKQRHEIYDKLYFGEPIVISTAGDVIAKDIAMDALKINWNEIAKNERGYVSKWVKKDIRINRFSTGLFTAGFLISAAVFLMSPAGLNGPIFAFYVLIWIMRRARILKPSYKAVLLSKADRLPIPFAVIKVFSEAGVQIGRAVSNQLGRYFLLVPLGTYYVTIEKKLLAPSEPVVSEVEPVEGPPPPAGYEKIYQSGSFRAKKIVNRTFRI